MTNRKMPSTAASELWWMSPGDTENGWTKVGEEEGEARRWSQNVMIVVRDPEGELWAYDIDRGLTENQDSEFPWQEYGKPDLDEIEVYAVHGREVTVTDWFVGRA